MLLEIDVDFRRETDGLGEVTVPVGALYGGQTMRAVENFPVSGQPLSSQRAFVAALGRLKAAAACANLACGELEEDLASAIGAAARELARGALDAELVVDMFEGGGGTSINMNVNEVLANAALAEFGHPPGDYARIHPNDHVNRSQSTNDVIPSAIRMACHELIGPAIDALNGFAAVADRKATEYADALRLGRTCLQDAQPMMLGQAIGAYAAAARRCAEALARQREEMLDLPLGATAIGTGFGAAKGYRIRAFEALRSATGVAWRPADPFDGLSNADGYARLSGELRNTAGALGKIANDLQILSSGPAGGLAELKLPPVQPGSSIMPGKVNPVIPMAVRQVGFAVAGYDAVVAAACQDGQLEINPYEPVIALHLFLQLRLVTEAARLLNERCMAGLSADRDRMRAHLDASAAVATALLPSLGYLETARLVSAATTAGRPFGDLVVGEGHLTAEALEAMLARCTTP